MFALKERSNNAYGTDMFMDGVVFYFGIIGDFVRSELGISTLRVVITTVVFLSKNWKVFLSYNVIYKPFVKQFVHTCVSLTFDSYINLYVFRVTTWEHRVLLTFIVDDVIVGVSITERQAERSGLLYY